MGEGIAQSIACPVCAGSSTHWFEKANYKHFRCLTCGHGFVHPLPDSDAITAYYGALSAGLSSDCSWSTEPRHKLVWWCRMLKLVEQKSGKGPLLDIGCGGGQFLQLAESLDWSDLTGVEISSKAAEIARTRSSAVVNEGAWRDINLDHGRFVCAALLDVLEHDPEPRALLLRIREWLCPGACLMITVPNIQGFSLRVFGRKSFVVIPPEHLAYYSGDSLRRLLEDCGYEVVWRTTCDLYLKEWLRFLPRRESAEGNAAEEQQRVQYEHAYARATGRIALWGVALVNSVLGILGAGDQLVMIARRPLERL